MNEAIQYEYCPEKDKKLREERGIGFTDIAIAVNTGCLLATKPSHNSINYPNQFIMVVKVDNYVYEVPYEYRNNIVRLITIWPSRKMTRRYQLKGSLK
tara:strand:+ start:49522 stop:49815 length:294 start_codon:yes stop_codon:yes gene_type:complete